MHRFSEILILLGIAGLTIPFLHRFLRISPVLGYLLCGVAIGPGGPLSFFGAGQGVVAFDPEIIGGFAELGVIFLMFMIGLKLALQDLWRMRHHIMGLGGSQIVVTAVAIAAIARLFGNGFEICILVGACFALSSTAIVMQLLEESGKAQGSVGRLCFSILLMQDLAVIPILTMLAAFSGAAGGGSLSFLVLKSLAVACAVIALIYFTGNRVLRPVLNYLGPHKSPEWLVSFVLFLVIGVASLTEAAGLSAALGAFLAGLLLAETEHKEKVEKIIAPVKGLLMGVFFLSIGLMIDLRAVADDALWLVASVAGIGFLKAALLFVLARAFRVETPVAAETAVMMGQSGEFVFIILTLALSSGIIPVADAQFFMLVTALSMLATPFVVPFAGRLVRLLK